MTVIAVYSIRTNRCRRIIRDNLSVSEIIKRHVIGIGEEAIEVPSSVEFDVDTVQEYLNKTNEKIPINDRYVGIIREEVAKVIIGDPDCGDAILGASLVESIDARIGWRQLKDKRLVPSKAELSQNITTLENQKMLFRNTSDPIKTTTEITIEDERLDILIIALQKDLNAV